MDRGEAQTPDRDEDRDELRSSFDQLAGFLNSIGDVYARAHLKKQLDILYDSTWTGRELDAWFSGKLRNASGATGASSSSDGTRGVSGVSSDHAGKGS